LDRAGLILGFYSGVYVTAVGATNAFGSDSSKLIGLCGMSIGLGEIFGGGLFGLMGKRFNRHSRSPIIIFGFILHLLAFFFTFLNLPDDSSIGKTDQKSYLDPK
jgi:Na+/proline symporter